MDGRGASACCRRRRRPTYAGQSREFRELGSEHLLHRSCWRCVFIYLVLAAQFESFIDPFVIMLSVPLSMTGALLALWLTGGTLNIYSQIGLVTLVGPDHQARHPDRRVRQPAAGARARQAATPSIEAAVLRLRPILMTTGAMVLGAVPLALAHGAGAESRTQIGWVIVGGMIARHAAHAVRRADRLHAARAHAPPGRARGAARRRGAPGAGESRRSGMPELPDIEPISTRSALVSWACRCCGCGAPARSSCVPSSRRSRRSRAGASVRSAPRQADRDRCRGRPLARRSLDDRRPAALACTRRQARSALRLGGFRLRRGQLVLTEAGSKRRASLHLVAGARRLAEHDRGGIEPLTSDLAAFAAALRRENHTLKRALTDPRLFAGIGNAYSDEILHVARLSPLAMTGKLTEDEFLRLHVATRDVLAGWVGRLCREAEAPIEFASVPAVRWPQSSSERRPEVALDTIAIRLPRRRSAPITALDRRDRRLEQVRR